MKPQTYLNMRFVLGLKKLVLSLMSDNNIIKTRHIDNRTIDAVLTY